MEYIPWKLYSRGLRDVHLTAREDVILLLDVPPRTVRREAASNCQRAHQINERVCVCFVYS